MNKYTYSYLYFLTPDLLTSVNCESKTEPPFFCLPFADLDDNLPITVHINILYTNMNNNTNVYQ